MDVLKNFTSDLNVISDQFDLTSLNEPIVKMLINMLEHFASKHEIQPMYVCLRHLETLKISYVDSIQINQFKFFMRIAESNIIAADQIIGIDASFANNSTLKFAIKTGNLDAVKYLVEKNVINDLDELAELVELATECKFENIIEYLSDDKLKKSIGSDSESEESDRSDDSEGESSSEVESASEEETKDTSPPNCRTFKVMSGNGDFVGRYVGTTPKVAASKAFTQLMRKIKCDNGNASVGPISTKVVLKEESRDGTTSKIYTYNARRVKLDQPQEIDIPGPDGTVKKISYTHANQITKCASDLDQNSN
jgi:hypothetical protein